MQLKKYLFEKVCVYVIIRETQKKLFFNGSAIKALPPPLSSLMAVGISTSGKKNIFSLMARPSYLMKLPLQKEPFFAASLIYTGYPNPFHSVIILYKHISVYMKGKEKENSPLHSKRSSIKFYF